VEKPLCYRMAINLMEGYRESGLVHRDMADKIYNCEKLQISH